MTQRSKMYYIRLTILSLLLLGLVGGAMYFRYTEFRPDIDGFNFTSGAATSNSGEYVVFFTEHDILSYNTHSFDKIDQAQVALDQNRLWQIYWKADDSGLYLIQGNSIEFIEMNRDGSFGQKSPIIYPEFDQSYRIIFPGDTTGLYFYLKNGTVYNYDVAQGSKIGQLLPFIELLSVEYSSLALVQQPDSTVSMVDVATLEVVHSSVDLVYDNIIDYTYSWCSITSEFFFLVGQIENTMRIASIDLDSGHVDQTNFGYTPLGYYDYPSSLYQTEDEQMIIYVEEDQSLTGHYFYRGSLLTINPEDLSISSKQGIFPRSSDNNEFRMVEYSAQSGKAIFYNRGLYVMDVSFSTFPARQTSIVLFNFLPLYFALFLLFIMLGYYGIPLITLSFTGDTDPERIVRILRKSIHLSLITQFAGLYYLFLYSGLDTTYRDSSFPYSLLIRFGWVALTWLGYFLLGFSVFHLCRDHAKSYILKLVLLLFSVYYWWIHIGLNFSYLRLEYADFEYEYPTDTTRLWSDLYTFQFVIIGVIFYAIFQVMRDEIPHYLTSTGKMLNRYYISIVLTALIFGIDLLNDGFLLVSIQYLFFFFLLLQIDYTGQQEKTQVEFPQTGIS